MPQLDLLSQIDDHDIHRGDMGQILAQWWRLMASRVALDLLLWAMCSALYGTESLTTFGTTFLVDLHTTRLAKSALRPMLAAYRNFFPFFFDFDVCRFCTSKRRFGYFRLQLAMPVLVEVLVRD